ncbi:phosphatase PAP2 family protein [Acinetobacter wuhouensis]|uniref:phosphatase PAP2 family protein n=1 Tax=Acinetobacter TaxID=469 RepID=UPI00083A2DC9|nr:MULTISPECIES: phosphatase PAP2 family protein [Acinetobacter]AXQ22887.1 phosphatase PAP2 family protein [Acinetobacter wuhouensis]RZG75754.1 phosphatase PAP2 family protein [Acinetobacter sp. WCHAc060025]RZG82726.1 phosphatase PAP2 family protein [Acinetobacter sp. WCHAc060033]
MSIESLNLSLFQLLNAPDQASPLMVHYAIFIANDLIYLLILIFAIMWLRGNNQIKKQILKAFIFTCLTLTISQLISHFFYSPRPFVMEVGQTLIQHKPTGSFPSNHMTIFSSIAFAYYFSAYRQVGKLLIAVAWLVAWSRVYVGVHFPIDMFGAFFLALFVNISGLTLWNKYKEVILNFVLWIHQKIFKSLIQKGYVK